MRGRVVAAWILLLTSAAAWLSPLALADPPLPGAASLPTVEQDVEKLIFQNAKSLAAFALLKLVPAAVGLGLLILEWVRLRDVRKGLLPPLPPLRPATAPVGVMGGVAAVFAFVAIPSLVIYTVANLDAELATRTPVHLGAVALGGIPLAIYTVVARRRLVTAGAPGPVGARPALRDALRTFCVAALLTVMAGFVLALILLPWGIQPRSQKAVNQLAFSTDPLDPWSISVYGVLAAPWIEECVFRGLLQPALRNRFGVSAGVWLTSLVFTGLHYEKANGLANILSLSQLLILAFFLARLRDRTDSILATTVVHALSNATSVVPVLLLRT
jgi:membrane protease YdiL (CAAX protease family)